MPLVREGRISEDPFVRVLDDAPLPEGVPVLLPAARLLADARDLVLRPAPIGVIWPYDRKVSELAPYLDWIALVALVFPTFRDGRAYSYAPRDGGGWRNSVLSYSNDGATSLFTTVEDMARWLRNFETGEVGGKAAIESLTTRGVLASGKTIDYALGLAHGTYRGTPAISHSGSDAGFRAMMIWLPEHRLGVAVLANLSSFDAGGAAQAVIDIVIGDRLAPAPAETGGHDSATSRPAVEVQTAVLDEYVGAYLLDIGALVTIARRDSAEPSNPSTTLPASGIARLTTRTEQGALRTTARETLPASRRRRVP